MCGGLGKLVTDILLWQNTTIGGHSVVDMFLHSEQTDLYVPNEMIHKTKNITLGTVQNRIIGLILCSNK